MYTNYAGFSPGYMPRNVDLRQWVEASREDQRGTSTCVANATVNALELLSSRAGTPKDLSRLFVYWNARSRSGIPNDTQQDAGTKPVHALDGIKEHGIVLESQWPFQENLITVQPSQDVFNSAFGTQLEYKYAYREIPSVYEGSRLYNNCRMALAEGFPVIIVMQQSDDLAGMWGPLDQQTYRSVYDGAPYAGIDHCMLAVGYTPDYLIVENSYGNQTGDNGYIALNMSACADMVSAHIVTSFNGYRFLEERSALFKTPNVIKDHVNALLNQGRAQEILDGAKAYFITDKQLEIIMSWTAGTVKAFKNSNPSLNWDGFYWDV